MKATTKKRLKKAGIVLLSIFLCAIIGICAFLIYNHCYHKHIDSLADSSVPPAALKNPEEWEVTFMDNFDTLDKTKWKIITFDDYNNSRKCGYYTDDNDIIFIKDGKLHISTKWKEGKHGEGWYTGFLNTSKIIDTKYNTDNFKGFSQVDGYFEIRCIAPPAYGMWSAFWMMPENPGTFKDGDILNSAEDGVEIDIMESFNWYHKLFTSKYAVQHVIHADDYDINQKTLSSRLYFVRNLYFDFHTYGVLWEGNKYTFFIDGKKTWETKHVVDGIDMGPCITPEYLILSTEILGDIKDGTVYEGQYKDKSGKWVLPWGGNPIQNDKNKSYDFIVDYVRCYKKK